MINHKVTLASSWPNGCTRYIASIRRATHINQYTISVPSEMIDVQCANYFLQSNHFWSPYLLVECSRLCPGLLYQNYRDILLWKCYWLNLSTNGTKNRPSFYWWIRLADNIINGDFLKKSVVKVKYYLKWIPTVAIFSNIKGFFRGLFCWPMAPFTNMV